MKKVAILIETDFFEKEIFYYHFRFAEEGIEAYFMSRLWGQPKLTFYGHEFKAPFDCDRSFENMTDEELGSYSAVIVPAGYSADRLRYTEDITKLPPASLFMKRAFENKNIIKGIICHGLWLMSPVAEVLKGRKGVVHNNLLGDAKNYGLEYVDSDVFTDGDFVTARTGEHCGLFAHTIIGMIK